MFFSRTVAKCQLCKNKLYALVDSYALTAKNMSDIV